MYESAAIGMHILYIAIGAAGWLGVIEMQSAEKVVCQIKFSEVDFDMYSSQAAGNKLQ